MCKRETPIAVGPSNPYPVCTFTNGYGEAVAGDVFSWATFSWSSTAPSSRQALEASPQQRSGRLAQPPEVVNEGRPDQLKRQGEQDRKGRPHHMDEEGRLYLADLFRSVQ